MYFRGLAAAVLARHERSEWQQGIDIRSITAI